MYPEFEYFLESYCTLSINQDEANELIKQYIENEHDDSKSRLKSEIKNMIDHGYIEAARQLIEETGNRILSRKETIDWLTYILGELEKGDPA